jgi:long-chain acyl-CoA synthetase
MTTGFYKERLAELSIPEMFDCSAEQHSSSVAMRYFIEGRFPDITYAELKRRVDAFAQGLARLGFSPGEKVALLSENRPEWGVAYLGVLKLGGVTVPLDPQSKAPELSHIVRESGARVAVVSAKYAADLEEIATNLAELDTIIHMDEVSGAVVEETGEEKEVAFKTISLQELTAGVSEPGAAFPRVDPEELATLIYTSGTTGQSKGVMLTHRNIMSDIAALHEAVKLYPTDNFLSVLPLHHTFECTCGFLTPLSEGAMITHSRSLKSRELLEDIKHNRVTILLGVPLLFEKMLAGLLKAVERKPASARALLKTGFAGVRVVKKLLHYDAGTQVFKGLREKAGLSSLRLMISGGAPLPPEIAEGFTTLGIKFLQGYGLTETSPVLTLNPEESPKPASIGKPLPGVEMKIVDPDGNGIGELVARGPMIMKGYYDNAPATSEVLRGGWFYTGDSGWVDEEGYYYVAGRIKDVIVTPAGKNVYPEEVEFTLAKSPYVLEVLVLGKPASEAGSHRVRGEEVQAIIVPDYEYFDQAAQEQGTIFDEGKIEATIREEVAKRCAEIADYKRVKYFTLREEEFEKTSTRKIKRYLFRHPPVAVSETRRTGRPRRR